MSEPQSLTSEILVVGGGPAGLYAALALAATGAEVTLLAPRADPADGRTTALLSGSVDAIGAAGGWDAVAPAAHPLRIMRLIDGTRRLIRAPEISFHASELGLDAFGYNVGNADLVAGLESALQSQGRVKRLHDKATGLRSVNDRVAVTTESGSLLNARLVVAADGRGSAIRELAGIEVRRWTYPQTALVLNVEHTASHHDTSTEFHTETGPFTLVPFGERRSAVVCIVRPDEATRLTGLPDGALALDLERRCASLLGQFTVASPRQTWPMSGLSVSTLARDRIVLVGETAHAFPPIGAQGLNLGIRDIAALARLVAAERRSTGGLSADLAARYAAARQADVTTRTVGVDLLNRSLLTSFLPVQAARWLGLQLARDVKPFRRLMMQEGLRPRLFAGT